MVVAWSKESVESPWVVDVEANDGLERNILIPVHIEEVRPPRGFRQLQAANLVNWRGEVDHPEFKRLLAAIEAILGPPKSDIKGEAVVSREAEPNGFHVFSEGGTDAVPSPQAIAPASESVLTNSIGMQFVLIPAGSFMMGSRMSAKELVDRFGGGEGWYKPEKPYRGVKIERPFYLQTTPVTQGQWQRVMGNNPSNFKDCGDDCPVEQVSWDNVQQFMNKLNQIEKTKDYRLPSEAEWEYGCRAGSDAGFSFGDDANGRVSLPGMTEIQEAKHILSERRSPTPGAFTTCTGTCGSGWRTTGTAAMRGRR